MKTPNVELYLCSALKEHFPDIVFTNKITVEEYDDVDNTYCTVRLTGGGRDSTPVQSIVRMNLTVYGGHDDENNIESYNLCEEILEVLEYRVAGPAKPVPLVNNISATINMGGSERSVSRAAFTAHVRAA